LDELKLRPAEIIDCAAKWNGAEERFTLSPVSSAPCSRSS
jgi:hypothetical protein